jgi:hypothetical protein
MFFFFFEMPKCPMLAEMYLGAGYLDGPRKFQKITFLHVWWPPQIRSLENGMEHGMEHGMEWGSQFLISTYIYIYIYIIIYIQINYPVHQGSTSLSEGSYSTASSENPP